MARRVRVVRVCRHARDTRLTAAGTMHPGVVPMRALAEFPARLPENCTNDKGLPPEGRASF